MAYHDLLWGPSRAQSSRFFLDRAASSPQSPRRGPVIANMCTRFQHPGVHIQVSGWSEHSQGGGYSHWACEVTLETWLSHDKPIQLSQVQREPHRNTCTQEWVPTQRELMGAWRPSCKRHRKALIDSRVKSMPAARRRVKLVPAQAANNCFGEKRFPDSQRQNNRALPGVSHTCDS